MTSASVSRRFSLSGPNPLPPDLMTASERRAELCALLALGLVRLMQRERPEASAATGEFPLHSPPDPSVHATPNSRRPA